MDRFSCAAEIISGDGALAALEVWRGKRMLLVTQPHLERDGRAQQVLQAGRFGQTMFFSVDREHPTVNLAAEGAAKLKAFSPDVVAVLGDSRVADCAGMMVYFGKRGCPLVMIPTVPWAGRETAAGAELTHEGIRYCVADRSLEPAKVILEPGLASADARNSLAQQGFETLVNALLKSRNPKNWFRAYFNHGLIHYVYGQKRLLPCDMSIDSFFIDPYGDVMPCNGTEEKLVMGNLNRQSWQELWNSPQAEAVRQQVRRCDRRCWMIGSASPAMHRYLWVPGFWVVWHRLKALVMKKPYTLEENLFLWCGRCKGGCQ